MAATHTDYAEYQALLYPIALKMLGNEADAKDQVQETLLNWLSREHGHIENARGYLVRSLINKCLNFIRDHQKYSGHEISPELLLDLPPARIEHEHLVSASFRMLFEKLNPVERAVFLLKEVFHYSHKEIAELLELNDAHCRQILTRAKKRLKDEKVRFEATPEAHEDLFQKFMEVCQGHKLEELLELLQADIATYRGLPVNGPAAIRGTAASMQYLRTYLWPCRELLHYRLEKKQGAYFIYLYLYEQSLGHLHIYPTEAGQYQMDIHPYQQLMELAATGKIVPSPV